MRFAILAPSNAIRHALENLVVVVDCKLQSRGENSEGSSTTEVPYLACLSACFKDAARKVYVPLPQRKRSLLQSIQYTRATLSAHASDAKPVSKYLKLE